jgi:hypothetical protein
MPFESTIRDFVIKVSQYHDELEQKMTHMKDLDARLLYGTQLMQLERLRSLCTSAISEQIKFERKLRDNEASN